MQGASEFQITVSFCGFLFNVAFLSSTFYIILYRTYKACGDKNGECQSLSLISGSRNVTFLRKHPWIWITVKTIFWCLAADFLHVNKEGNVKLWTPCCALSIYIYNMYKIKIQIQNFLNQQKSWIASGEGFFKTVLARKLFYLFHEQDSKHTLSLSCVRDTTGITLILWLLQL